MNCVKCEAPLSESEAVLCDLCTVNRSRAYLKAQIGLMGRLAKLTNDNHVVAEIVKRQIRYMEELNATF